LAKPFAEIFRSNSSIMAKLSVATVERMEGEYQVQSTLFDAGLTTGQKSAETASDVAYFMSILLPDPILVWQAISHPYLGIISPIMVALCFCNSPLRF
jgi:hypothetical protein